MQLVGIRELTVSVETTAQILPGMLISDPTAAGGSNRIPSNTYVKSINNAMQITMSGNASLSVTKEVLGFANQGGNTASGSDVITNVFLPSKPDVGQVITGNGIPLNTTITSVDSSTSEFHHPSSADQVKRAGCDACSGAAQFRLR